MIAPEQAYALARAVGYLPERTVAALAAIFGLEPATLVDCGYQFEVSRPPPDVQEMVFVPRKSGR